MTDNIKWCCAGFEAAYQAAGERNIAIIVDDEGERESLFFLQARAFDVGQEPPLMVPVPMSLVQEVGLRYCPWCGVSLAKWYRRNNELKKRADLRIVRK